MNQAQPLGSFAAAATLAPAPIASALDGAKVPLPGAIINCPVDQSEVIVLRFVYSNTRILTVNVSTLGCRFASNGDRSVFTPQSVLSTLEGTLGQDRLPGASSP